MHRFERITDRNLLDVRLSRCEITHAIVHGAARDRAFRRTR
jgi:hypothetical protein